MSDRLKVSATDISPSWGVTLGQWNPTGTNNDGVTVARFDHMGGWYGDLVHTGGRIDMMPAANYDSPLRILALNDVPVGGGIPPVLRIQTGGTAGLTPSDGSPVRGSSCAFFAVGDGMEVIADPTQRGTLYGLQISVQPRTNHGISTAGINPTSDDVACLILENGSPNGSSVITECIFIGRGQYHTANNLTSYEWGTIIGNEAYTMLLISTTAHHYRGIDFAKDGGTRANCSDCYFHVPGGNQNIISARAKNDTIESRLISIDDEDDMLIFNGNLVLRPSSFPNGVVAGGMFYANGQSSMLSLGNPTTLNGALVLYNNSGIGYILNNGSNQWEMAVAADGTNDLQFLLSGPGALMLLTPTGDLVTHGNITASANLIVNGTATLTGGVTSLVVGGTTQLVGAVTVNGVATFTNFVTMNDGVTINSTLDVTGLAQAHGDLYCFGMLKGGSFTCNNDATIDNNLTVNGVAILSGGIDMTGGGAGFSGSAFHVYSGTTVFEPVVTINAGGTALNVANGDISAHGDLIAGGVLRGGFNGGGVLRAVDGGSDNIGFYRQSGDFYYDLNQTTSEAFCTQSNCRDLDLAAGAGPVSIQLGMTDRSGNPRAIYCDTASDVRIKEHIAESEIDALALISAIPVRQFDFKPEIMRWHHPDDEQRRLACHVPLGLVAQEVLPLIPDAVSISNHLPPPGSPMPADCHHLVQQNIVPYLVRAVQQLAGQVRDLERMLVQ